MRRVVCLVLFLFLLVGSSVGGTLVQFRIPFQGDVEVELYDQDKPVTVRNFLRYVKSGLFTNNVFFHRCLPGFVLQGGGFGTVDRSARDGFLTTSAVFGIPTFPPITNEFKVGRLISNTYGTIAMAKTSNPDSATSQYFFNLSNNAVSLDNTNNSGGFTVFGHVVRGTNVLNYFNTINKTGPLGIVDLTWWYGSGTVADLFSDLPVAFYGLAYPRNDQLAYVDVSLLNVQVRLVGGAREISWNSVAGKFNHVEYTTVLPPVWQLLQSVNGTGAMMKVTDSSTGAARRFYRVRVDY